MTHGFYEDDRTVRYDTSAVSSFCRQVKTELPKHGLFPGQPHELLRELCVKLQCCDWIPDDSGAEPWRTRVERKREIAGEIDAFCKSRPVNKARLLHNHKTGQYIALLSAIKQNPEAGDDKLILQIRPANLGSGFAYSRLLDTVESLKTGGCLNTAQLSALSTWLNNLPSLDVADLGRINKI